MTATAALRAVAPSLDLRPTHWHRPLLVLAAVMVLLAAMSVIGMLVDPRTVTGLSVWSKPLKFALSTAIYAFSLAWLIGQLRTMRRLAGIAGTVSAVALGIELVIITGFAVAGDTSHFNVSTPFHTAMWSVMASSIAVVWILALLVAVALFRNRLGDPARTLAIRAGAILGIIGMALAFLMTSPTAEQLANFQGIAGAHTVGLADGGPGLPILGWSTVAGDLRVPHFVGMHALQLLPIAAILLELLARRVPLFADARLRLQLISLITGTYASVIGLVTWQALAGQSVVRPEGVILITGLAVAAAAALTAVALVAGAARRTRA